MLKIELDILNISINDRKYPETLKRIENPPSHIHAVGNIDLLKNKKIAVIGSRKNTEYGKNMALNFAKKLSNSGYTIVSGLAIGIDSFSHIGAMVGKSKTIAILPCGFKNIYPKQNKELLIQIIENGGLAITEYEINSKAKQENFIKRNRIVAGLSDGLLIIEGSYRSGTSTTAKFAIKNKIPVFCIPHNLDSKTSYTPNFFIKQGGRIVTNIEDITNILECKDNNKHKKNKIKIESNITIEYEKKFCKKIKEKDSEIINRFPIYSYINDKPIFIDELVNKSKISINEINYQLTILIVEQYIKELPNKSFIRKEKLKYE